MSVRIDGDLHFQKYYYDVYQEVSPIIVSDEIYAEYLNYKSQCRIQMFAFVKSVSIVLVLCLLGFMVFCLSDWLCYLVNHIKIIIIQYYNCVYDIVNQINQVFFVNNS